MIQKVIFIGGPTATGKTDLSIWLAEQINGEIINADSMQIYKKLKIGTAAPSEAEFKQIKHHLFDFVDPTQPFSVSQFRTLVDEKISDINRRGKIPIVVGGTGFYIYSIINDLELGIDRNSVEYESLVKELKERFSTNELLHQELERIDPKSADLIPQGNNRKVLRAIVHKLLTNESFVDQQTEITYKYDPLILGLNAERSLLYDRINLRVDKMIRQGLLKEGEYVWKNRDEMPQATQAIGYKELFNFFDGNIGLEEAVNQIKQNTRRYAKRQITWFNNKLPTKWYDIYDLNYYQNILRDTKKFFGENING